MDKVTYYLNWMGPINAKWIETNGEGWSGGRIDIQDGSDYGKEWSMPVVSNATWYAFREFLDHLVSDEVLSFDELVAGYEKRTGNEMEYWPVPEVFDDPRS